MLASNAFIFWMSKHNFIFLILKNILKNIFTGFRILGWHFIFNFSTLSFSFRILSLIVTLLKTCAFLIWLYWRFYFFVIFVYLIKFVYDVPKCDFLLHTFLKYLAWSFSSILENALSSSLQIWFPFHSLSYLLGAKIAICHGLLLVCTMWLLYCFVWYIREKCRYPLYFRLNSLS